MFETVTASRFDRRMNSGRTWPCLMACTRANADEIEVVAKFSAGCSGVKALAAEAIAAMLAADLGLPVPEPVAVQIDEEFISIVNTVDSEIADRLRISARVAFGSTKLPAGFALLLPEMSDAAVRAEAAEIFAFDALIQNNDRRPSNQNFLHDGRSFAIFDHELCFITEGVLFWRPPWELGSLETWKHNHALYSKLTGRQYDFGRFIDSWSSITAIRLDEYLHALPNEWVSNPVEVDLITNILIYLNDVRENIDAAMTEIARVLS